MERLPTIPGVFVTTEKNTIAPNPRTTRASDFTWFNSCGANIIRSNYNTCTSQLDKKNYRWGLLRKAKHRNVGLLPTGGKGQCNLFHNFTSTKKGCPCGTYANCGGKKSHKELYVNPN